MPPPRKGCPHAEADIAEAAGGVGTHPDGHTLAHLGTHPSPLIYRVGTDPAISGSPWGQTPRRSNQRIMNLAPIVRTVTLNEAVPVSASTTGSSHTPL